MSFCSAVKILLNRYTLFMRKLANISKREVVIAVATAILVGGGNMTAQQIQKHDTRLPYAQNTRQITWLPSSVNRWRTDIEKQAAVYNLDPNLIAVIMTIESGGYTKADSGQAQGLMQITPTTAKEIAQKHLKTPVMKYDIWNPETNIEFGTAYLAYLRTEFCDYKTGPDWACVELIAAGYNGGPGAANSVFKGEGLEDVQTVSYARDALNMYREKAAAKSPTYTRWLDRGGQSLVGKAANETKYKK